MQSSKDIEHDNLTGILVNGSLYIDAKDIEAKINTRTAELANKINELSIENRRLKNIINTQKITVPETSEKFIKQNEQINMLNNIIKSQHKLICSLETIKPF
jgi:endonuclease III